MISYILNAVQYTVVKSDLKYFIDKRLNAGRNVSRRRTVGLFSTYAFMISCNMPEQKIDSEDISIFCGRRYWTVRTKSRFNFRSEADLNVKFRVRVLMS